MINFLLFPDERLSRHFFSPWCLLWGPSLVPGGESYSTVADLYNWFSLSILTLRLSTLSLLQFFNLRSSFPTWQWFLWWMVIVILCIHLYISPVLEAIACPVSSLLLWSKESCWVFHLFSFLLVFRTNGWLPISLHVELETQVHSFFFFLFSLDTPDNRPFATWQPFLDGEKNLEVYEEAFQI